MWWKCGLYLIKETSGEDRMGGGRKIKIKWQRERKQKKTEKGEKEIKKDVERERLKSCFMQVMTGNTFSFLFCHDNSSVTSCSKTNFSFFSCSKFRCSQPFSAHMNSNNVHTEYNLLPVSPSGSTEWLPVSTEMYLSSCVAEKSPSWVFLRW